MKAVSAVQWRLAAEVWLWRHGCGWVLVALLIAACAIIWAWGLLPLREARAEAQARNQALVRAPKPAVQRSADDAQKLASQELQAVLPTEAEATRLIARTLALAREHAVAVEQAEYQYQSDPEMQWVQMNMTLPVRGGYPQTRRFIETVLREHPHLALNQIGFKKDTAGASQPEATVSFSAWFKRSK